MSKPLEGVRVVEVAAWTFVPVAGGMMADMGAEVIKVEPPTGDPQRGLENMQHYHIKGPKPFIQIPNRGKRSITVDLRIDSGREVLRHLVSTADVFLTSYLPQLRKRFKIDVQDIRAINPNIIYAKGSGWGPKGPKAGTGGYDSAAGWASSGIADLFSSYCDEGAPPMPSAFFDLQGGNTIAGAISTALFKRERTGEASVVDVSLLNVGMWAMAPAIVSAPFRDPDTPLPSRKHAGNPITNYYRTKDNRWIFLVALQSDRFWAEVCQLLERVDLIEDPRYRNSTLRSENREACIKVLDSIFLTRTLGEWIDVFSAFSGVWAPAQSFAEIHHNAQIRANGYLQKVTSNEGLEFDLVSAAMHFDGEATAPQGPAPEVGQDTETLLMESGMEWEEIERHREAGAFG